MTLTDTTVELNARLVARLYDERGGYYLLRRLVDGKFRDVRPLTRAEALTYYCRRDEVLRHVYPITRQRGRFATWRRMPRRA